MNFERTIDLHELHAKSEPAQFYLLRGSRVDIDTLKVTRIDGSLLQDAVIVKGTQDNFLHIYFDSELVIFIDVEYLPLHETQFLSISSVADEGIYQIGFDYENN